MANKLEKGRTFNPGDTVEAADLNLLVDGADALKGIISEQTQVPAATGDHILIVDASDSGNLKKALISSLPGAGTVTTVSVSPTAEITTVFTIGVASPATTPDISFAFKNQVQRTFLAGAVSGSAKPSFRAILPVDTSLLTTVAAYTIDLDAGNTFWKVLPDATGARTFLLKNGSPGQISKVIVQQAAAPGGNTVAWDTDAGADIVRWPAGTPPVMSTGAHATDIYEFTVLQVGGGIHNYYGIRWGAAFDV